MNKRERYWCNRSEVLRTLTITKQALAREWCADTARLHCECQLTIQQLDEDNKEFHA